MKKVENYGYTITVTKFETELSDICRHNGIVESRTV